ncbi:uncharacterized protein LOC125760423 [Anopheles funestus]|uniref:uncharacterized protein LOC125760423 n=1 Tax=Anopheles funestus TaxID=62324 RepID=UPI0020C628FF|nr:uncharacterized protein LOC125760423 [Anopheles funestus]
MDSTANKAPQFCEEEFVFTEEKTLELISEVQKHEVLWKKQNKNYKNTTKQDDKWHTVSKAVVLPVAIIKAEWKVLRAQFRTNNAKAKQSCRSGAGAQQVYKPTWFGYVPMLFLRETMDVGFTRDTVRR